MHGGSSFDNICLRSGRSVLKPHLTPELYYYAQPVDPRRRDGETTTFVPQVKIVDIAPHSIEAERRYRP